MWTFKKRVPADVLRLMPGPSHVKRSLQTRNEPEAKARCPAVAAEFEAYWAQVRMGLQSLTPKQCDALAGEIYVKLMKRGGDGIGGRTGETGWTLLNEGCKAALEPTVDMGRQRGRIPRIDFIREFHGRRVDELLAEKGIAVTQKSYDTLLFAVNRACHLAAETILREGEGDYTPDPEATKFPVFSSLAPDPTKTFDALWKEYCNARNKDPEKVKKNRRFFERMIAHVGTDDMRAVTEEHLLSWREKLQKQPGLSQTTIKDGYFAAVKAFFKWAKRQKLLPIDPSAEVYIEVANDDGKDMRGLTDEEAKTILGATLATFSPLMMQEKRDAHRWVAWLCAYTGARVNEITQLRAKDVRKVTGIWCLDITPEAGSTKNKASKRTVPIHQHLVEQGFLDFAGAKAGDAPLFYSRERAKGKAPYQTVGNKLAEWVRGLGITDPAVAPNHGWRHRFKTVGRRCAMRDDVMDAIQGHTPITVGKKYGVFEPDVMLVEIAKIPRYEVEPTQTVDRRRREVKARLKAKAADA
jgi:integrase